MTNRRAFTLIELLVVIAIIAILAAILFPVFAEAKRAAKQASDLSNVKEMCTGNLIYLGDHDDAYLNRPELTFSDPPTDAVPTSMKMPDVGLAIYPYVKNVGVMGCVLFQGQSANLAFNDGLTGLTGTTVPNPASTIMWSDPIWDWPRGTPSCNPPPGPGLISQPNPDDEYPSFDFYMFQVNPCPNGPGHYPIDVPSPGWTGLDIRLTASIVGGNFTYNVFSQQVNRIYANGDVTVTYGSGANTGGNLTSQTDAANLTLSLANQLANNKAPGSIAPDPSKLYGGVFKAGANYGFTDGHAKFVNTVQVFKNGLGQPSFATGVTSTNPP